MKTLLLLFFILGTAGCQNDKLQSLFGKTFRHAYEDDKEGMKAFRPKSYNFPPARGRSGFRLEEDGTFVSLDIAPADGTREVRGNWEVVEEKPLTINVTLPGYDNPRAETVRTMRWELVSVTDSLLYVRVRKPAEND